MPVVAVNVIKVLFVIVLYLFLFQIAKAMRSHLADSDVATAPPVRRRSRSDEDPVPTPRRFTLTVADTDPVPLTDRITIGRGRNADITIEDSYASDVHAAFGVEGESAWVEDLGSTNGTVVDGKKIESRIRLEGESMVLIGRTPVVIR